MARSSRVSINWKGPKVAGQLRAATAEGLTYGAIMLARFMKDGMKQHMSVVGKTKSGKNIYRASPPGSYPGIRLGNLWRSIKHYPATPRRLVASAGISLSGGRQRAFERGLNVNAYGLILEYSRNPRMRRPWGRRSLTENRARIRTAIFNATRRAMLRMQRGGR